MMDVWLTEITMQEKSVGRKKTQKKQNVSLPVDGKLIDVTLTPPTGKRKSWYAYWKGLNASRSTGQANYYDAVQSLPDMLGNDGPRSQLSDTLLSDAEFEQIQRCHYARKTEPAARNRSEKSLRECLDAISAFQAISRLDPISKATAEDCERFQQQALELPKNWRVTYSDTTRSRQRRKLRDSVELLSPSTVHKWSVALRAAYNRANANAGRKCVRSVVPTAKLLSENPWDQFTWIEPRPRPLRQFSPEELLSLLDHFGENWPGLAFAPAFVAVSLWSGSRRREISSLRWEDVREVGTEIHFESIGKHAVTKWFRVPRCLYEQMCQLRKSSPYVFGDYPEQLQRFYREKNRKAALVQIQTEFDPENVGDWMYRQVSEWSKTLKGGPAYLHCFRKTSLQYAFTGEHIQQIVARDASVTPAVMMASYARATDEELRQRSNATFHRLLSSLPVEVAVRYGHEVSQADRLHEQLDAARGRRDWDEVGRLAQQLHALEQPAG